MRTLDPKILDEKKALEKQEQMLAKRIQELDADRLSLCRRIQEIRMQESNLRRENREEIRGMLLENLRQQIRQEGSLKAKLQAQAPADLNKLQGNDWRQFLASLFSEPIPRKYGEFFWGCDTFTTLSLPENEQLALHRQAKLLCQEIRMERKAAWLASHPRGLPGNEWHARKWEKVG